MPGYHERLKFEIARRDNALANIADCGISSVGIVAGQVEHVVTSARAELESVSDFVSAKINATGNLVSDKIDDAGDAVGRQIEMVKTTLDPAPIIRKHPWATTLGAVLGGILVVPLLKSLLRRPRVERVIATSISSDAAAPQREAPRDSNWKPVTDALLANLPLLISAFVNRYAPPAAPNAEEETSSKNDQPCHQNVGLNGSH
jgi:hypothetical protein